MSVLPDELWRRIIEIGVVTGKTGLSYKDLCCLSITCRRLHRISDDNFFWSSLLSFDFSQLDSTTLPSSSSSNSSANNFKNLYKIRYEKDRERKVLVRRRAVLRIESVIAEHVRKIEEIEQKYIEESERMKSSLDELMNLHRVRQASVALNVWQPEVVRGKQNHLVEQCDVPVDFRIHTLEMELKLCKQQVSGFEKASKVEKRRLDAAKDQLASLQYHPLQDFNMKSNRIDGLGGRRKKMKTKLSV